MKYSPAEMQDFRTAAINHYKEGKSVAEILVSIPQVTISTIYRWIRVYRETGKTERSPIINPATIRNAEVKEKALALYRAGLNCTRIQKEVKVVGRSTISRWVHESQENPVGGEAMKTGKRQPKEFTNIQTKEGSDELRAEMGPQELLAKYKRALAIIEKQNTMLTISETMITLAEKEFGITIRKKPGAK